MYYRKGNVMTVSRAQRIRSLLRYRIPNWKIKLLKFLLGEVFVTREEMDELLYFYITENAMAAGRVHAC